MSVVVQGGQGLWPGVSAFIKTLLDDADAATARSTLGAVNKAGDTMTGGLAAPSYYTAGTSIADDAVYSLALPFTGTSALLIISASGVLAPQINGVYWVRKSANAPTKIASATDTNITLGTRDLTGTTGTDGGTEMNVVSSTTLKIENRSGGAVGYSLTFIGV